MNFTGERMVPEFADAKTFWEHIHRYKFALNYVKDKEVLDIACGEGYGTRALVEGGASRVIGVDVSGESCDHARAKYGVDARQGDAEAIPLADDRVDVVISFETIEHVAMPGRFLAECYRVLRPGGTLVVSTPEVDTYGQTVDNPYHCSEMSEAQFRSLIGANFERVRWFSQSLVGAGWWSLRSVSAIRSPWRRVRGFWRLAALCPHRGGNVDDSDRRDPVAAILGSKGPLCSAMDPYRIHRRATWTRERPTYLVAVARKPRP